MGRGEVSSARGWGEKTGESVPSDLLARDTGAVDDDERTSQ